MVGSPTATGLNPLPKRIRLAAVNTMVTCRKQVHLDIRGYIFVSSAYECVKNGSAAIFTGPILIFAHLGLPSVVSQPATIGHVTLSSELL